MKRPRIGEMARLFVRIAAGLLLLVLIWSCANVPGLHEERITSYIRVPFVRVLLQENSDSLVFSSNAAFAVECLAKGKQVVF
ncbi:MAG: hypothetical protein D6800_07495, partial [Candidatus Zixiibacteriota bacterium]